MNIRNRNWFAAFNCRKHYGPRSSTIAHAGRTTSGIGGGLGRLSQGSTDSLDVFLESLAAEQAKLAIGSSEVVICPEEPNPPISENTSFGVLAAQKASSPEAALHRGGDWPVA
jgi:hypothetical protein